MDKIKMKAATAAKLQLMADRNGMEPGECVDALLEFATSGAWFKEDPAFQSRFTGLLETAIENARGSVSGWGAGDPRVSIKPDGKADLKAYEQWIREQEKK